MFNMRRTREKVVATVVDNVVVLLEQGDVAGLGDRVAAEVDDAWWQLLQQCRNNVGMQAGARRINDDDFLACNIIESLFAGSKDSAGVGAVKLGNVALHFADSVGVDFHQRDVAAANGQTNSADASVKIENWLIGSERHLRKNLGNFTWVPDYFLMVPELPTRTLAIAIARYPLLHIAQRLLVNRDVDLEKAFAGVAEWYAKDSVSQGGVTEKRQALGDAAGWRARVGIDNFPALSW